MTVNRTTLLDLPLPVTGTESGTWGDTTNNGLSQYMDIAIAGMNSLTSANFTAGALTLANTLGDSSATNIAAGSAQYATIRVSSLAVNSTITAPGSNRSYRIINADATYSLTIKASGQTGVTFLPGQTGVVAFNGTDYVIVGVVGAGTATDNAVARFDGTTGEIIQNSGVTIDDSNNVSGIAQLNITTLDATNIEVTNIKAKDGTAAASIADSTGVISITSNPVLSGGTANGVLYLNGSKVATSGSALTFDGTNFATTGTASATKFIPTGGTATGNGMYLPTSNELAWSNNGSETMRLTSTGLGIGTSSPGTILDVFKNTGNDNTLTTIRISTFGSPGDQFSVRLAAAKNSGGVPYGQVMGPKDGNGWLAFTTGTSDTERARITSGGDLLVGTTTASSKLTVNSEMSLAADNNNRGIIGWDNAGKGLYFGTINASTTYFNAMTLKDGNLGVGTTSPATKFNVSDSSSNCTITVTNSASNFQVQSNNNDGYLNLNGSGNIIFRSGTPSVTERARITSGGDLLVGLTAAQVGERLSIRGSGTALAYFDQTTNTSGYSGIWVNIEQNGNDTSTYHFKGETTGINSWYLYGNGTTSYSSDSRLKKNIETARNGYLDDLMKLRVVKYNWNSHQDGTPKELGLIAQEVEEVFPNLIQEHEIQGVDGPRKHIKHSVMEFILIKAIQEQQALITSLTARVALLEGN